MTTKTPFEPFTIHFLGPVTVQTSPGQGSVFKYGDELVVTEKIHSLSLDRSGNSWLDMVDDPDLQRVRFGEVRMVRGPWPDGQRRVKPGSVEEQILYADARAKILAEFRTSPELRSRLLDLRLEFFGTDDLPATSRTLSVTAPDAPQRWGTGEV